MHVMPSLDLAGIPMPVLGLGTWRLAGPACRQAVEHALEIGYRHIDTAEMYGNEAEVGEAIRASGLPRREVFVTTKIWHTNLAPDRMWKAAEASLERLRLSELDLLLLHWPKPGASIQESLAALAQIQEAGLTRRIGVANCPPWLLDRILASSNPAIVCNQVEYHPFLSQEALLQRQRPRGMALVAYCPLAKGRVASDPTLLRIASRLGCSPAQVALRWLLSQDGVAAIPKAASTAHCRENIAALSIELSRADNAEVSALARGLRIVSPEFAPAWDEPAGE
jgi:2,5-diketo-D-gluconate reductase B